MEVTSPADDRASPTDDRAAIAARVAGFDRVPILDPGLRAASVAVCVVIRRRVPCLLITKRAATLGNHPGQWALPGERSLQVPPGDVLGVLDDYRTRSGYIITPVVIWGGPLNVSLSGPVAEVAQVYVIPLADLDQPPQLLRIPESERPVLRLPLLRGFVYAPTAAVIYQFCQLARHGLTTRGAQLEQPVLALAWRR